MKIRRKIKRSTKQYIIVAVICIVIIGGAAAVTTVTISGQIRDKYMVLLNEAHQEMEDNQRTVYIAEKDIMTGEYLTEKNVKRMKVYATQPVETFITSNDIGKVALVDISKGTQVLAGMLSDKTVPSELREMEYTVINISSNIQNNNTVDVRIVYPNGESYVILSKKLIKGYSPGTSSCYFWMDEDEILRMSAAIVDAGLYKGSSLYITKYIEPNIQEASLVNYTPSLAVLNLLENNPNILKRTTQLLSKEVRKALEKRLADSLTADVTKVSWNVNPYAQLLDPTAALPSKDNNPESSSEEQAAAAGDRSGSPDTSSQNNELGNMDTSVESSELGNAAAGRGRKPGDVDTTAEDSELGSADTKDNKLANRDNVQDYFSYAEAAGAGNGDIEYGE